MGAGRGRNVKGFTEVMRCSPKGGYSRRNWDTLRTRYRSWNSVLESPKASEELKVIMSHGAVVRQLDTDRDLLSLATALHELNVAELDSPLHLYRLAALTNGIIAILERRGLEDSAQHRERLLTVKNRLSLALIERFPEHVRVRLDPRDRTLVLLEPVGIWSELLHMPRENLPKGFVLTP